MVRHIWPNVLPLVVANTFLNFAFALVALAGALVPRARRRPGHARLGPHARREPRRCSSTTRPRRSRPAVVIVLTAVEHEPDRRLALRAALGPRAGAMSGPRRRRRSLDGRGLRDRERASAARRARSSRGIDLDARAGRDDRHRRRVRQRQVDDGARADRAAARRRARATGAVALRRPQPARRCPSARCAQLRGARDRR